MKTFTLILPAIFLFSNCLVAQTKLGNDIGGVAKNDYSGSSVSMPDSSTIAIGAYGSSANGNLSGQTRIYSWNGSAWVQKGNEINGEAAGDWSGWAVSMGDNNTVAIGAIYNDGKASDAGHVRVFSWSGSAWVQKGADIEGSAWGNGSGYSVSMPDNNTVAIGATLYGSSAGQVRVFFWNETAWAQKGTQIIGEAAEDQFGGALSMPDSNTVAVGARKNDGNGSNSGHVRIYRWNGSDWAQKGSNLVGEDYGDEFGTSVSMPDSNIVAIGAPKNTGSGASSGHVRIFQWIDTAWVQKGADIDGEETSDESGRAVSMPNANTVAIGATLNNGAVFNAGHVRVFVWNGSAWVQRGTDIEGDYEDGMFGVAVSMPDSNTVGVGANADLGNNNINAGKTRVYSFLSIVGIAENTFGANLSAYPNPTTGQLTINLGSEYRDLVITQSNEMGQTVNSTQHIAQEQKLQYQLVGEPGIYFIEVSTPGKRAVITVIKKQ